MEEQYDIHNNGGRPYTVKVCRNKNFFEIYENIYTKRKLLGKKIIYCNNYINIFIGDNCGKHVDDRFCLPGGFSLGNSILVKVGVKKDLNRYLYIGDHVYFFYTDEEITFYCSPIGRNDVPYPYAVSNSKIYFLIEDPLQVEKKDFHSEEDYYDQLYESHRNRLEILNSNKNWFSKQYNIFKIEKKKVKNIPFVELKNQFEELF
jgi:hypothetical protein